MTAAMNARMHAGRKVQATILPRSAPLPPDAPEPPARRVSNPGQCTGCRFFRAYHLTEVWGVCGHERWLTGGMEGRFAHPLHGCSFWQARVA
jgi:hypothetical protein